MRDAIADGVILGPRMYVAGAYVTISEGAGAMTGLSPDIQLPPDLRFGEANSPWEVRQKIRVLAHRGQRHAHFFGDLRIESLAVLFEILQDLGQGW
jgi:hypothetical protein